MQVTIRDAEPADVPAVIELMRALAEHEGHAQYFKLTPEVLHECTFGDAKRVHILVAIAEGAVVGYANYLFQFSPWAAAEYLFLDDIYVADSHRGARVGLLLMQRVAAIALERDVEARWNVEKENRSALRFYTALGAVLRERVSAYWLRDAMRAQVRP